MTNVTNPDYRDLATCPLRLCGCVAQVLICLGEMVAGWRDTGSPQSLRGSRLQPWLHMGAPGRTLGLPRLHPSTIKSHRLGLAPRHQHTRKAAWWVLSAARPRTPAHVSDRSTECPEVQCEWSGRGKMAPSQSLNTHQQACGEHGTFLGGTRGQTGATGRIYEETDCRIY